MVLPTALSLAWEQDKSIHHTLRCAEHQEAGCRGTDGVQVMALDPGERKVREGILQKFPEQAGVRKYGSQEGSVKDISRTGAVCPVHRAKTKCLAGAKDTWRGGRVMRRGRGWRHEALGAKLRPPKGHRRTVTSPILFRSPGQGL